MVDKVLQDDVVNGVTRGQGHAALTNDTKRAVNEVIDELENYPAVSNTSVSTIKQLLADDTILQYVGGFYTGSNMGGGYFQYDPSRSWEDHNGFDVLAQGAIAAWTGERQDLGVFLDWVGTGAGCFIRKQTDTQGNSNSNGKLLIFCGDSTTEQAGGNGYMFDGITSKHRGQGGQLEHVKGYINFGGSGYQLDQFIRGDEETLPTISPNNLGVGQWDYYGHKPTGAVSLNTALKWREDVTDPVQWVLCYGINDCILRSSVGNKSYIELKDFIKTRLKIAVTTILDVYPTDDIVLRSPNPMVARPYVESAGFPSPSAYPNFGDDLSADIALVDKWNGALNDAYTELEGMLPRTTIWDTWEDVFIGQDASIDVGDLRSMGDLVHPSGGGYQELGDSFAKRFGKQLSGTTSKRKDSEFLADAEGREPWEVDPLYFIDNPKYQQITTADVWVSIGSNHFDIGLPLDDFLESTGNRPIWISIGDAAAQYFETYSARVAGANTRLTSISPSTEMQASKGIVRIYASTRATVSSDSYVSNQHVSQSPRNFYTGRVTGGGSGYIDFAFDKISGRPSTKYPNAFKTGTLVIGGGSNTNIDLSTASYIDTIGAPSLARIRIGLSGDQSSHTGKTSAIFFDDDVTSIYKSEPSGLYGASIKHDNGERGFVLISEYLHDGASLSVVNNTITPNPVTVNIYKTNYPKTLIGTITIPANQLDGDLVGGVTTSIRAGTVYEFEVTSPTVAGASITLKVEPT